MATFSADVRVLVCANCGAPLPSVGVDGGQVQCTYCHVSTFVGRRDDGSIASGAQVDENQRIAALWQQVDRGFDIHPEVLALMERSQLPERNVDAAMQRWEQTRVTASDPAQTASVGDDLLWLTTALAGFFSSHGDRVRVRAMWESALDASHGARQRQYVRGSLCRLAVNDSDLAAAMEWLRPCDPQPGDLCSDSTYRLSYSFVATANGELDHVLQALGPDANALPWFFSARVLSAVVRANAIEKRGDMNGAVAQLQALVSGTPDAVVALPGIRRANVGLDLCPQSIPIVAPAA
jgi:hypothetical protein